MDGTNLTAINLGKKFHQHQFVLRHLDLHVKPNQRGGIFGPNGAGKTTLLKLMTGLFRPTEGIIEIDGISPFSGAEGARIRSSLGFVSHQTYLYNEMTVLENLDLHGKLHGIKERRTRIITSLENVGMTDHMNRPVGQLSRGMQQRIALARSTLHEPELIVFDEPDTGLDDFAREKLQGFMQTGLSERTMIITTHNLELGMAVTDRWIIQLNGAIAYDIDSVATTNEDFSYTYKQIMSSTP